MLSSLSSPSKATSSVSCWATRVQYQDLLASHSPEREDRMNAISSRLSGISTTVANPTPKILISAEASRCADEELLVTQSVTDVTREMNSAMAHVMGVLERQQGTVANSIHTQPTMYSTPQSSTTSFRRAPSSTPTSTSLAPPKQGVSSNRDLNRVAVVPRIMALPDTLQALIDAENAEGMAEAMRAQKQAEHRGRFRNVRKGPTAATWSVKGVDPLNPLPPPPAHHHGGVASPSDGADDGEGVSNGVEMVEFFVGKDRYEVPKGMTRSKRHNYVVEMRTRQCLADAEAYDAAIKRGDEAEKEQRQMAQKDILERNVMSAGRHRALREQKAGERRLQEEARRAQAQRRARFALAQKMSRWQSHLAAYNERCEAMPSTPTTARPSSPPKLSCRAPLPVTAPSSARVPSSAEEDGRRRGGRGVKAHSGLPEVVAPSPPLRPATARVLSNNTVTPKSNKI
eukprot:PhM_4_TR1719/c0_g1_i1/m.89964